jgi:2-polyprenyl-6-hydroxyphenyl methylase/3-demethylubiquinone-9 3-methyltransferase
MKKTASTLAADEAAHFAPLAADWWNREGPASALHAMNPARLAFIRTAIAEGLKHKGQGRTPLKGIKVLDAGCGGGLLSEPLARLGAEVTGLDASAELIDVAKAHSGQQGLKINYLAGLIEDLAISKKFDVVVASEVLEHVADPALFLHHAAAHLGKGGVLVATTLNRTLKSLTLGIVVAEKVLGLAPEGTHHWRKFLKPSELAGLLREIGFEVGGLSGLRYNPFTNAARLHPADLAINYLMWAKRAG